MKKLALALALPSYRDVRVYLVHEKGSVVAYLLVPRGAFGCDVQAAQSQIAHDLGLGSQGKQHQAGHPDPGPVMRLPEGGCEWVVGEAPHFRLGPQAQHSHPGDQGKGQA